MAIHFNPASFTGTLDAALAIPGFLISDLAFYAFISHGGASLGAFGVVHANFWTGMQMMGLALSACMNNIIIFVGEGINALHGVIDRVGRMWLHVSQIWQSVEVMFGQDQQVALPESARGDTGGEDGTGEHVTLELLSEQAKQASSPPPPYQVGVHCLQ